MSAEQIPYDRNNNDTYVELLSRDPAQDAEAHMFRNPNGGVVGPGRVMGNFSEESRHKAVNAVLRFPSARDAGLATLSKILKLNTPLPMTLVRRYERKADGLCHAQKTPVYFDTKLERFVVLLDARFLRDIEMSELGLDAREYREKFKVYEAVKTKNLPVSNKYLGLLFESIDAIRQNADGSPLQILQSAYKLYNLRIADGEKVIVLRVAQDHSIRSMLVTTNIPSQILSQVIKHSFQFEFAIAYRFGDVCYLQSKDGEIEQAGSFHINKARDQDREAKGIAAIGRNDESLLLVLPYTEAQFELLSKIHDRMSALTNDVMSLFEMHQQPKERLDSPIDIDAGALTWIKPLLLDAPDQKS